MDRTENSSNNSSFETSNFESNIISNKNNKNNKTKFSLLHFVHFAYNYWAIFIVRNSIAIISICTLLTTFCTLKVVITQYKNDITGYTPYGARSRQELAIREHFFNENDKGSPFGVFLLLLPNKQNNKENNNFLNDKMLEEAIKVDEIVNKNFPLFNLNKNRSETFSEFCRDFCELNEPLRRFQEGFHHQIQRLETNETLNPNIQLNYPLSSIFGRNFNIQLNISFVSFKPNFFGIHFNNNTNNIELSNMAKVEMVALIYKAERVGGWSDDEVKNWQLNVSKYFDKFFSGEFNSSLIRVLSVSTAYVEVEVVRAGLTMLPFIVVGFVIMLCCSSVFVLLSASYMNQFNYKRLWLALMACLCPLMASGTALGLLFLFGVRFGTVLCVTPFLVLAIGVDDAYLMIHAWQRIKSKEKEIKQGKIETIKERVTKRMALVLVDTGPAILISALTNVCADAIGSFTGSPEITLLCMGSMAAITVDFIYQVTFYAAVIALLDEAELKSEQLNENNKKFCLSILIGSTKEINQKPKNKITNNFYLNAKNKLNKTTKQFVEFLMNPFISFIICLFWIVFVIFSAIGVSHFKIDHYREQQIVPFFTMATIFVNNPGNLSNPSQLQRLNKLVNEMESLPESWGYSSTNYFIRDLTDFLGEESLNDLNNGLNEFLMWPENKHWKAFVRTDGENGTLKRFFFTTAYHGERLKEWAE
uniref:SSD domain-containing protein n=1 Tax=Meloidogyne hapla TaxID=6305 RepID=A0A1I8BGI7_MELHA